MGKKQMKRDEYRNIGSTHSRSGEMIMHGEIFEPTDSELKNFGDKFELVRKEQPAKPAKEDDQPPAGEGTDGNGAEGTSQEGEKGRLDEWPLESTYEKYLERYPEGPYAALAKAYIAQEKAQEKPE